MIASTQEQMWQYIFYICAQSQVITESNCVHNNIDYTKLQQLFTETKKDLLDRSITEWNKNINLLYRRDLREFPVYNTYPWSYNEQ